MSARQRPPRAARPATSRTAPHTAAALLALLCAACSGGDASSLDDGEDRPGGDTTNVLLFGASAFLPAASNISLDNQRMFATGNAFFNQAWTEAPSSTTSRDGLGPLFNARSCSGCHFKDGRGRPPLDGEVNFTSLLLRIGAGGELGPDGAPVPDPIYGDQLQPFGAGIAGEGSPRVTYEVRSGRYADGEPFELLVPTYSIEAPNHGPFDADLRISPRAAPAMIGLGLLEAIPEARLTQLSDPEDEDGDGISGRINRVWDVTAEAKASGRFGWKAEQPSVRQQVAGAFLGDMGITSPLFAQQDCTEAQTECREAPSGGAPEISERLFERVVRYSQLVAVPARQSYSDPQVLRGKARFAELGCASCHTPSHRTASTAELAEVRDQLIWPYTDLLLHDLGEDLSDQRPSFEAAGSEWRTPPLWGIGHYPTVNGHQRLLHDGRARGVAEAILWHGGEAEPARRAFIELPAESRHDLVAFVESL